MNMVKNFFCRVWGFE